MRERARYYGRRRIARRRRTAHARRKQIGVDPLRLDQRLCGIARRHRARPCFGLLCELLIELLVLLLIELLVELQLASRIEQAQLGQQELVEQLLPGGSLGPGSDAPHAGQGRVGRGDDSLRIVFEVVQRQQLIVA